MQASFSVHDTSDEAEAPKGGVCNRAIAFTLAQQGGVASDTRPRKAHPSPACIPIKATKQTRSIRSLGRRSPLPSRGGMKRVCTFVHWGWVYLPILGCVFQAAILCGRVLEGERRSMQETPTTVPVYQGASRRKLTIHANEAWALTIVPGAVCFPPRCERRSGSLAGEGEGKRDLEGFAVEGAPLMRRNQFPGEERACEDRKQPRGRGSQALGVLVLVAYPSAVLRICRWRSNNPSPCTVRG